MIVLFAIFLYTVQDFTNHSSSSVYTIQMVISGIKITLLALKYVLLKRPLKTCGLSNLSYA